MLFFKSLFHDQRGSRSSTYPRLSGMTTLEVLPCQGLGVCLCCQQLRHSSVAIPRLLSSGEPPWPLCSRACWETVGWLQKEASWYPQDMTSYPFEYQNSPPLRSSFGENSHRTQISSRFPPSLYSEKFIHIILPQISLSPIYPKSLTIQPNHRPQTMDRYLITCLVFFLPNKVKTQGCCPSSAHWEDFPSPLPSGLSQRGAAAPWPTTSR